MKTSTPVHQYTSTPVHQYTSNEAFKDKYEKSSSGWRFQGVASFAFRVVMIAVIFTRLTTFSANAQITPAAILDIPLPVGSAANVNHISCDGYVAPNYESLQLFAWDGPSQNWACHYYNNLGASLYNNINYSVPFGVEHPEVALMSNYTISSDVYAIVVYNDPNSKGATYEIHKWIPATATFTFLMGGQLTTSLVTGRVINVAGDEYGHFAIICDDGPGSSMIHQLVGHIDPRTFAIVLGTVGVITYPGYKLSEPDIDITYFTPLHSVGDAMVHSAYLAIAPSGRNQIVSAATGYTSFAVGGTYNISADITGETTTACDPSHPSIAVNDGYQCDVAGIRQHAGVTYKDVCGTSNNIMLYPVTYRPSSAILPPAILNTGTVSAPFQTNNKPVIATKPFLDDASTVAWDFIDAGGAFAQEGVAHASAYSNTTNLFAPITVNDLQVNFNVTGTVKLCTVSGMSPDEELFFYYDNLGSNFYYKKEGYFNTALRTSSTLLSETIKVFPNPVEDYLSINSTTDLNGGTLSDISGRKLYEFVGNKKTIEQLLNQNLSLISKGIYLLTFNMSSGENQSSKIIKQ